jgi:hypothetical protein
MELNVKTTLEERQAEMKRWHFNQTKGYVKALDYYHCHQIAKCGRLTFAMTPISEALDHVVS